MTNIDYSMTSPATFAQSVAPASATIVAELLDIIRKHTKTTGEDWNASTTLEDVGVDSFDLVELIFEIEDKYGVDINFNANKTMEDFSTVGDVASLIEETLAKQSRVA